MKTTFFLTAFLLFSTQVDAHPISMDAICEIESRCQDDALGASGEVGRFQISPIVLAHFNDDHKNVHLARCIDLYETDTPRDQGYLWRDCTLDELKKKSINERVADWYMRWIYERTGNVDDAIIAWNRGYGNWKKWVRDGRKYKKLPEVTQEYLKKYEKLTGEKL